MLPLVTCAEPAMLIVYCRTDNAMSWYALGLCEYSVVTVQDSDYLGLTIGAVLDRYFALELITTCMYVSWRLSSILLSGFACSRKRNTGNPVFQDLNVLLAAWTNAWLIGSKLIATWLIIIVLGQLHSHEVSRLAT